MAGMSTVSLDQLLELEHDGWKSLCEGRGGTFYGDLMTNDGLMVLVNGMVLDRAQVVESLDDSPAWDRYEISEPRLVALNNEAAAVVYMATAVRDDSEPFTALMSSIYRLMDGRLRLALYQQTMATH
jgi:hypothetical protein